RTRSRRRSTGRRSPPPGCAIGQHEVGLALFCLFWSAAIPSPLCLSGRRPTRQRRKRRHRRAACATRKKDRQTERRRNRRTPEQTENWTALYCTSIHWCKALCALQGGECRRASAVLGCVVRCHVA